MSDRHWGHDNDDDSCDNWGKDDNHDSWGNDDNDDNNWGHWGD